MGTERYTYNNNKKMFEHSFIAYFSKHYLTIFVIPLITFASSQEYTKLYCYVSSQPAKFSHKCSLSLSVVEILFAQCLTKFY